MTAPHDLAQPMEPAATVASLIRNPVVVEQARRAGGGPFLDLPLPQLPPPPAPAAEPVHAGPPSVHDLLAPPPGLAAPAHPGQAGPATGDATAHLPQLPGLPPLPQLPQLPPLPADPVAALMQGIHVPALPGVNEVMAPVLSLLNSFGTGVFQALNPAHLFQAGSQVLDTTMQTGSEALQLLMSAWQGQAASAAHSSGKRAAEQGAQTSKQGKTIADITNKAAGTVNQGYTKLVGIVQSFAAQAVALGPTLPTPPGQTALIATATAHLAQGSAVVAETQAALGALSADINAAGGPLAIIANSVDVSAIADQAQQAVQAAQPVVSQVSDAVSNVVDKAAGGSGEDGSGLSSLLSPHGSESGEPGATSAASFVDGAGLSGGLGGGFGGSAGGGGFGGGFSGFDDEPTPGGGTGPLASPTLGGTPSSTQPGTAFGATPAAATGAAVSSTGGPMGVAPAAAGRGASESQHSRSVAPHHGAAHRATDGLNPVPPAVLGAEDPEEDARYEREYGYHAGPETDHDGSAFR